MRKEWWEEPACIICDFWWLILIVVVLGLTAYFTRNFWIPLLGLI
jgi:hypothetical protein